MSKNIFKNIFSIFFKRKGKKNMLIEKLKKLLADGLITQEEYDALAPAAENSSNESNDVANEPVDNEAPADEPSTDEESSLDEVPVEEENVDEDPATEDVADETPTVENVPTGNEDPTPEGAEETPNTAFEQRLVALEKNVELILQKLDGASKKPQEVTEPVGGQRKLFGYSKN